jgi:H+/Cl- antiporter ClcA
LPIGAISAVVAKVLVWLIALITNISFFHRLSVAPVTPQESHLGYWVIVVPVIGALIIGFMARYGSEKIRGHGIPEALEAILLGRSLMQPKVAILKPLSSAISIGTGGPFGAEGPIIMTGGACGSIFAQLFHLSSAERKTLLVAGAAGGMSAIFATPVAAVLLGIELLLFEWKPRSFIPVAVASIVASLLRVPLLGNGPIFPVVPHAEMGMEALAVALLVGILTGLVSGLTTNLVYACEDLFKRLPVHWMWWPALGGLAVGLGGLVEPRALGVGYDVIGDLLHNHLAIGVVLALLGVKAIIWVIALGSGTSGGVLAPLLMMGAGLGVALSQLLPGNDPALWPMVCMAATLGGVMRAPLTATIFAFGLTHDSNALLPLLATSAVAYGFTVLTMRRSILTEKIARRGYHIYREYGVDPLERHFVEEVMTREVRTIDAAMSIEEALATYFGSNQVHRAFPVLRDGILIGVADRANLATHACGNPIAKVADALAQAPLRVAYVGETCRTVATRLARHGIERMPVVRDAASHELAGIVARSDLIKPSLVHFDEEEKRERMRGMPWQA